MMRVRSIAAVAVAAIALALGCHAPPPAAALPPRAPAPPAIVTALPALAPIAARPGTCGGIERLPIESIDIVGNRLRIAVPRGGENGPPPVPLMAAAPPAETEESRVYLELPGGAKLVVYAREEFALATGNLDAPAAALFADMTSMPRAELDLGTIAAGSGVLVLAARPKHPREDPEIPEAVVVLDALVAVPDGGLLHLTYYVNPAALTDPDGCRDLALVLAHQIRFDGRTLDLEGGWRALGELYIELPRGFAVTTDQGIDATVYLVHTTQPFGAPSGLISIAVDRYANRDPLDVPAGATPLERAGTLLGQPVTWRGWQSPTRARVIALLERSGRMSAPIQVQLFAQDPAILDALDGVVRTLRLRPGPL